MLLPKKFKKSKRSKCLYGKNETISGERVPMSCRHSPIFVCKLPYFLISHGKLSFSPVYLYTDVFAVLLDCGVLSTVGWRHRCTDTVSGWQTAAVNHLYSPPPLSTVTHQCYTHTPLYSSLRLTPTVYPELKQYELLLFSIYVGSRQLLGEFPFWL